MVFFVYLCLDVKTSTGKAPTMPSYNDVEQHYVFLKPILLYMEPLKVSTPTSILGWLNHVDMDNVAKVSKADTASTFRVNGCWHTQTLKMEAACISESSATLATSTQCNYLRTELTSIVKHCESLKSIIG
jgi:hypothetical protein